MGMALFAVPMLLAVEFPAGHLFIGGDAAKVYVAPQWGRLQSDPNGLDLSVEVNVETGRFLVAGTVMFAEPNWELSTANAALASSC